jgi:hypothetical protein
MQQNIQKNWNIILLDFLDLHQELIDFTIKSNSPRRLHIKGAFLHKANVTDMLIKIAAHRKNCLYLPYPKDQFMNPIKYMGNKTPDELF